MQRTSLKISGIYNQSTLEFLKENSGVQSFGFDLRPLSLNFIQHEILLEIMASQSEAGLKFYLLFYGEKDFAIHKFIDDLCDIFSEDFFFQNILLEFADEKDFDWYLQFKKPFCLHYHKDLDLKRAFSHPLCRGIHFSQEDFKANPSLQDIVKEIKQDQENLSKTNLSLEIDWEEVILDTLYDKIDWDFLTLGINNTVEVCYRHVDQKKLEDGLQVVSHRFHHSSGPVLT